jgi:hypothetical protein
MSAARDGEQVGDTWKFVKRTDLACMLSILGVLMYGLPRQAKSPYPTSSARTKTTLGAFFCGLAGLAAATDVARACPAINCKAVRRVIEREDKPTPLRVIKQPAERTPQINSSSRAEL